MKCALVVSCLLTVVAPIAAWAQSPPNLSGTWTLDPARSDAPPAAGLGGRGGRGGRVQQAAGAGGPVIITQTDTTISIGPVTYKLDGSTTTRGSAEAKAAWEGATLVIETTRNVQGMATKTRQVRSLDATGKEMQVENTITTPRGERKITQLFTKSGGA